MLKRVICLFKGHDLVLEREGGEMGKAASTIQEVHTRRCARCGHVNIKADIVWTSIMRDYLLRAKLEPRIMVERSRGGRVQIIVNVIPRTRRSQPVKSLAQRKRRR